MRLRPVCRRERRTGEKSVSLLVQLFSLRGLRVHRRLRARRRRVRVPVVRCERNARNTEDTEKARDTEDHGDDLKVREACPALDGWPGRENHRLFTGAPVSRALCSFRP